MYVIDMSGKNDLEVAEKLAKEYHEGQTRRSGESYVSHPLSVSQNLDGKKEKIVAALHDTIEDTEMTEEELKKHFTEDIVKTVKLLTKEKDNQDYFKYLEKVKNNELAKRVKIADMKHNLHDNPTQKQVKKYKKGLRILGERQ